MSTELSDYAVLQVSGGDAGGFLSAQLTRDVQRLAPGQHALAAWCDARGRALCTPRVVATETGFLLLLPADFSDAILRRLCMYVLRAKVEITDVTPSWSLVGMPSEQAGDPTGAGGDIPGHDETGYLLDFTAGYGQGTLWLSGTGGADDEAAAGSNAWQLAEIDAGIPEITHCLSGLFLPQMLNLHWLHAMDFDKGCYPGQEVIARLQYRGRLSKRMFRLQWQGQQQPVPGDDVLDDGGDRQGTIVRAAQSGRDGGRLLAVLRVGAADKPLTTGGSRLAILGLPYATGEQAVS